MVAVTSNINNFDASKIDAFDSVVKLTGDLYYGSGSLLYGTNYILTAAHVAEDLNLSDYVTFYSDSGTKNVGIASIDIHPLYEGIDTPEYDLALVKLSGSAPTWAEGYQLYEGATIYYQTVYFAGYGLQASYGGTPHSASSAMPKAWAANVTNTISYDSDTGYPDISPGSWDEEFVAESASQEWLEDVVLLGHKDLTIMDYDSGLAIHNALDTGKDLYGEYGLVDIEGIPQPGDSGAPILISDSSAPSGYKVLGIVTQGITSYADQDWSGWGDYGELSVNAKPVSHSGWVNWITQGSAEKTLYSSELTIEDNSSFSVFQGNSSSVQTFDISIYEDWWSTSIYQVDETVIIDTGDRYIQLKDIERIKVHSSENYDSYSKVAFDLVGSAGQAYRLYKAAFDRTPDTEGLGYWINQMDYGMSLQQVSNSFLMSAEFESLYGNIDDQGFINALYQNVLDREADNGGYDYWLGEIESGMIDRAGMLASFSESTENQENVIDLIGHGIVYESWSPWS